MSLAALEAAKQAKEVAKELFRIGLTPDDGNPATDFFVATRGADSFDGGNGKDTVSYALSTAKVQINLADSSNEFFGFAAGDHLVSIENLIGSKYDDNILGSTDSNVIHGNIGNDVIDGNGGSDVIFGGPGDDRLQVSTNTLQRATLDGGADNDLLKFVASGGEAEINTGTGLDDVYIKIMTSDEFHVVVNDFEPFLNHSRIAPSHLQAENGDRLFFGFNNAIMPEHGVFPHVSEETVGNDFVVTFLDNGIHGDVVFVGLAGYAGPGDFSFRVEWEFDNVFRPAPV